MNPDMIYDLVISAFGAVYDTKFGIKRESSNPMVAIVDGPLGAEKPLVYITKWFKNSHLYKHIVGHLGEKNSDGSEISVFPEFEKQAQIYASLYKLKTGKDAHIVFLEAPKEKPKKLEDKVDQEKEKPKFINPFEIEIPKIK